MITKHILKPEHEAQGLSLEDDEDFAYLRHGKQTLAVFNATTVTVKTILDEADKHISKGGKGNV